MSFFSTLRSPGSIATVIERDWNEPRDVTSGRLPKHMTARELESVYKRNPKLRQLGIEPCDVPKQTTWEVKGTWNGERVVDIVRDVRESALLRDPTPVRREPTKPTSRSSERTIAVAYHEGFHAAAALHNGVRVLGATIVPTDDTDGKTTLLLDREECPAVHAYISLAGEVSDVASGCPMSPDTYSSDRDIGGSLKWREAIRDHVREELHLFTGGAIEIARKLIAKHTLSEFEVKSAYITGQRRAREEPVRIVGGSSAKRTPVRQRHFDFSNPEHVRAFNEQMSRPLDAEPIGYCDAHLVTDSFR
jgi:hypothetical protein